MLLASNPFLEESLMKYIIVSFNSVNPVAAAMYCDMNTKTGGGR